MLHFLLLPAEVNRAFWLEHVTQVYDRYYTFGQSWEGILEQNWIEALRCVFAFAFLWEGVRSANASDKFLVPIGIATISGFFVALMQKKGFPYHFLIMNYLIIFGIPLWLRALARRSQLAPAAALAAATVYGYVLVIVAINVLQLRPLPERIVSRLDIMNYLRLKTQPGERVLIFTSNVTLLYPAIPYFGLLPGTRYLNLFPIAFFNHTEERQQLLATHYPLRGS